MPSIHSIRWIENLYSTQHELYSFDILNRGELIPSERVIQFDYVKKRKLPYVKGEFFLSKKHPKIYNVIRGFLEVTENEALEKIINEIKPDVIHSFEMQACSYPILKTMKEFPEIKWIYSCWGNDLYYYQNFKTHRTKLMNTLNRVDLIHTDCNRDYIIAKELGFNGIHLGVIPGGGGFKINNMIKYRMSINSRKIILVKGYQHQFGRGILIVKALKDIQAELKGFEIVIFGAHKQVIDFIEENKLNFKIFDRHGLQHVELLQLMGKSLIYIGNSISDGMPNTLLEAVIMGAFPIQSNPGGASAEIINHSKNGLLIENPESIDEIKRLVRQAIANPMMIEEAMDINYKLATELLNYEENNSKIIGIYNNILNK